MSAMRTFTPSLLSPSARTGPVGPAPRPYGQRVDGFAMRWMLFFYGRRAKRAWPSLESTFVRM